MPKYKTYRTAGVGSRMANAFDAGPMSTGGVRVPHGTLKAVDCPDCPALVGGPCVTPNGNPKTQVHMSRRRIAMRKYYADREHEATSLEQADG